MLGGTGTGTTGTGGTATTRTGTAATGTGGAALSGRATAPPVSPTGPARAEATFKVEPRSRKVSFSIKGAWQPSARILQGGAKAKMFLDKLLVIRSSVDEIQRAQAGTIDPAVKAAMDYAKEIFPTADEVSAQEIGLFLGSEKKYRAARAWLDQNAQTALREGGKAFDAMGDALDVVYSYEHDLDLLEGYLEFARRDVEPWYEELRGWVSGLHNVAANALEEAKKYAAVQGLPEILFMIYQAYFEAGQSLGMLESLLSGRIASYEARRRDSRNARREAIQLFNKWNPQWIKLGRARTGKVPWLTTLSVPSPIQP